MFEDFFEHNPMYSILIRIIIVAITAAFAAMLSFTPKGFKGTIPFLKQCFPSRKKEWYFRVNFILIIIIGTFFGYLMSSPKSPVACIIAGLTWTGSIQALLHTTSKEE